MKYEIDANDLRAINALHFKDGLPYLSNGKILTEAVDDREMKKDLKKLFKDFFNAEINFDSNFEKIAEFNRKHNIIDL